MYYPAILFSALVFGLHLYGQAVPDITPPGPNPPPAVSAAPPEAIQPIQKVGPDDLLSISVANAPELTRSFRVSGDGTLSLPMLRKRLLVSGKDTPEIEKEVADELSAEQILVQPVVSVSVAEFRSRPVSVVGAVHHPITFQATGNMTLMDALAKADGLAETAGTDILLTHAREPGDSSSTVPIVERIPVHQLVDEADPSVNVRLSGGEQIRVPFAGRVYVLGNVKRSGAYAIQDNDQLTVLKVLAESEGLAPYAKKQAYIFRKEAGQAHRNEIAVPLDEILHRKAPDVKLEANDILFVPDNKTKRVTEQTLERVLAFGVGTASGYVIFH
jgi:polysaccharide export outer membrane protein